jgi:hypothetical protein
VNDSTSLVLAEGVQFSLSQQVLDHVMVVIVSASQLFMGLVAIHSAGTVDGKSEQDNMISFIQWKQLFAKCMYNRASLVAYDVLLTI